MTKKEIIKDLESKGVEFDSSLTKKELIELFYSDEDDFKIDKYVATYVSKGKTKTLGSYATVKDAKIAAGKIGAHNLKIKHVTE